MRCCEGRLFLTDSVLIDGEEVLFGVSFGSALYGLMLDFPECVRQAVPRYGFADAEEDMCRLCRMCRGIRVDVVFLMGADDFNSGGGMDISMLQERTGMTEPELERPSEPGLGAGTAGVINLAGGGLKPEMPDSVNIVNNGGSTRFLKDENKVICDGEGSILSMKTDTGSEVFAERAEIDLTRKEVTFTGNVCVFQGRASRVVIEPSIPMRMRRSSMCRMCVPRCPA